MKNEIRKLCIGILLNWLVQLLNTEDANDRSMNAEINHYTKTEIEKQIA